MSGHEPKEDVTWSPEKEPFAYSLIEEEEECEEDEEREEEGDGQKEEEEGGEKEGKEDDEGEDDKKEAGQVDGDGPRPFILPLI